MKNLYKINKWLIIITLLLYLTIYLGMIFQMVLGAIQVLMSIYILSNYNTLNKKTKPFFVVYMVLTVIILYLIFSGIIGHEIWVFVYLIIPMMIAFLHLYITYQIKIS